MTTTAPSAAPQLSSEHIEGYRRNGFLRVPGVLTDEEVARYRDAAQEHYEQQAGGAPAQGRIFVQSVNVWQQHAVLRELTLHPVLAGLATELAGVPLRLWHDHLLVKPPHNAAATEFHQDRPYWPHATSRHSLSAWVALVDVPVERGCMTFLPGSHEHTDLQAQNLADAGSLFGIAPDLQWGERVTVPLRAGDCTFHHSYLAHMALPNTTDTARLAHVAIYMDEDTTCSGVPHVVTDPLGLQPGDRLDGPLFPALPA